MCNVIIAIHGDSESEEYFEFEECFGCFNVQNWFEVENKNGSFRRKVAARFLLVLGFKI